MRKCQTLLASVGIGVVAFVPLMVTTYKGIRQHALFDIDSRWTLPSFNSAITDVISFAVKYNGTCSFCDYSDDDHSEICYQDSQITMDVSTAQCHANADANQFKPSVCDELDFTCIYEPYVLPSVMLLLAITVVCCSAKSRNMNIQLEKIGTVVMGFGVIVCASSLIQWYLKPDSGCVDGYCDILPNKESDFVIAATCGYCLSVMFNATLNVTTLPEAPIFPASALGKYDQAFLGTFCWAAAVTASSVLVVLCSDSPVKAKVGQCASALGNVVGRFWQRAGERTPLLKDPDLEMQQQNRRSSASVNGVG